MQQHIKILLFVVLNETQHVSGDTPPIIRSLKLHKQPLVLHTWKVVGRAVVGRCQVAYASCTSSGFLKKKKKKKKKSCEDKMSMCTARRDL